MPSYMLTPSSPFVQNGEWRVYFSHDFIDCYLNMGIYGYQGETGIVEHSWWDASYGQPFRIISEPRSEYGDRYYLTEWVPPSQWQNQTIRVVNVITGNRVNHDELHDPDLYNRILYPYEFEEPTRSLEDGFSEEREETEAREIAPVLNTNIGRNVPLVSFEQEFVSNNGDLVAQRLYDAGYAFSPYVDGYHSSEGRHIISNGVPTDRFCYIETDSSCGYELIFDRVNLRDRGQAERISQVQTILKQLKEEEVIRLSARCGFHVHVDISGWGMKEIESAYHLWNYLEDPIFRIASAFWNGHRDEETGNAYSPPNPKGYTGKTAIGRNLSAHRGSLSFIPFLNARGHCRCQAFLFEDWSNCTCNLPIPTLEFRVFNATMNQRKIRAYLAFCVAFVNAAKDKEFNPTDYFPMAFNGTLRTRSLNVPTSEGIQVHTWEEAAKERLDFIINELPLTNSERGDILYCAKNSSLEPIVN